MKTKLLFIASAIMMVACSNQETFDSNLQQPVQQQASNIRSYEEALQIAQSSIEIVDGQAQTRAVSPRRIALNDTKIYKLDAKTRSSSYMNDTLMYVFNFENNQGFTIVSANRDTYPLIAVTESGYYDPEVPSENEGFGMFVELAKEFVRTSPVRGLDPFILQKDSVVYSHSYVGPYVNVVWGQVHPEGDFCPNNIAGCANTAVAQVMSYYESPSSISLTYEGADKTVQNLNWTSMKSHLSGMSDTITLCTDTVSHRAIARLCRQLGMLAQSEYNSSGTSTSKGNVRLALQSLGWNPGNWIPYLESNVVSALDNCHPMFTTGRWDKGDGHTSGHMWIIDGYDNYLTTTYVFDQMAGSNVWELSYISTESERLYHINWGWYGDCNGYFAANVFDVTSPTFPDMIPVPSASPRTNNYTINITTLLAYPN